MKIIYLTTLLVTFAFILAGCDTTANTNMANKNSNTAVLVNSNSNMNTSSNMNSNMSSNMNSNMNSNMPMNSNSNMNSSSNMNKNVSSADKEFMNKAAQGGMAEVKLGELAASKGQSADVKDFGQKMVTDHSKANDDLKSVAAGKGVTLPADVNAEQKATMDKLSKLSGAEFDKEYVKAMVKDHVEDVAEFQKQSEKAMDTDVKSFATRTLPTLKSHLEMIKGIQGKMK